MRTIGVVGCNEKKEFYKLTPICFLALVGGFDREVSSGIDLAIPGWIGGFTSAIRSKHRIVP